LRRHDGGKNNLIDEQLHTYEKNWIDR